MRWKKIILEQRDDLMLAKHPAPTIHHVLKTWGAANDHSGDRLQRPNDGA
jgi:hypothetical protein